MTAGAKSKVFGANDPALTYQLTSGNLVGSDQITGSLIRDAGETVGTYPIRQGSVTAGSNYDLTYVGANLTIGAWNAQGYGFYSPVDDSVFVASTGPNPVLPTANSGTLWNSVKGGSTVPLKFNVFAGTVEKTSLSDIAGFTQTQLPNCVAGEGTDEIEIVTTGNTTLRYESQWIQNWKTPTVSKETCYRATVKFADGSTLSAFFKLRK